MRIEEGAAGLITRGGGGGKEIVNREGKNCCVLSAVCATTLVARKYNFHAILLEDPV